MTVAVERARRPAAHALVNITLALLVIGIVAVYDASYARSMDLSRNGNDGAYFLKRQAVYAALGIFGLVFVSRFDYSKLRRMAGPLLFLSIILLCTVWMPVIGITKNGAARWIGWKAVQLQPSELVKLTLTIYLAALLSRGTSNIRNFLDGLFVPLAVIGVVVLLVEREPDLGTAGVIGLTSITLLYLAGARKRHLMAIGAAGMALVLAAALFGHGYRQGRLKTFLNPELDYYGRGYQVSRGLVAVGSGGLTGVGLGAGREKFYLPEANTDFIFATIAEETGLWGSLLVIGLLFAIARQGICIGRRTKDPFGALLASGIATMISWQAAINMAVVTGSIPATGVPLPFISYGGSSLLILLVSIGILLNIASQSGDRARA